jgi:hypothetical protein
LEAVVPPLLVLSTAYVLKEQVLETIEQRHMDERAFQIALAEWQAATSEPEQHPHWSQLYANALRDALRKANFRRQEALAALTTTDWRRQVDRELQAEQWYVAPDANRGLAPGGDEAMALVPFASQISRNGNGTHPA